MNTAYLRYTVVISLLFSVFLGLSAIALAKDASNKLHGADLIEVASDVVGNVDECKSIAVDVLSRYEPFLAEFEKLTIHTDTSTRRGLSDGRVIFVRCLEDKTEFEHVLIHEIGHVIDLSHLVSSRGFRTRFTDFGDPIYSRDLSTRFYNISWSNNEDWLPRASEEDFVSKYASSNPFEDFAETYLMYIEHGEIFRYVAFDKENEILQKKYNFVKYVIFNGKEFGLDEDVSLEAVLKFGEGFSPIFDMTKLFNLV